MHRDVPLPMRADPFQTRAGQMKKGSEAGMPAPEAAGAPVLCAGRFDPHGQEACHREYRVPIPQKKRWTLWARVRYPTGGDMSFGLVRPGEPVTLTDRQGLGNCGVEVT